MNKAAVAVSILCICAAGMVYFFIFKPALLPVAGPSANHAWTADDQRELAGKLKGAGLTRQSLQEYEQYVRSAELDKKQLANLSYTIGRMYMDAGDYEKALVWFFRVEIADPQTPLKSEVGSHIVSCLERSGKYSAAEYALSKRAAPVEAAQR
ncbi:MAG: hypothetical protein WCQ99_07085, partial [Pseudomonadota bacterium]